MKGNRTKSARPGLPTPNVRMNMDKILDNARPSSSGRPKLDEIIRGKRKVISKPISPSGNSSYLLEKFTNASPTKQPIFKVNRQQSKKSNYVT
jgi:hypothetical protein